MARPAPILALCAMLLLTGCLGMFGESRPAATVAPVVINNCVTVKKFTPAQFKEILAAEKALPADSPIIIVLQDWVRMRDHGRACAAIPPAK